MPWVEAEGEEDTEFLEFIRNYQRDSRPQVLALLETYGDREIRILKSRQEAERFLSQM